jgi:hypothetical protein
MQVAASGRERLQKLVWQLERIDAMFAKLDQQLDSETARLRYHINTVSGHSGAIAVDKYQVGNNTQIQLRMFFMVT